MAQTACIELGLVVDLPPNERRSPGQTLSCGSGVNPYCATYTYAVDDEPYAGYSAFGCAIANTVVTIRALPATDDSTTTSNGPSTTTSAPSSSRRLPTSSSSKPPTPSSDLLNVGATNPADNHHQLPAGTIAGSVVGGVAGIALLAAGTVVLVLGLRRKNKKEDGQAKNPAATVPRPPSGGQGESKDLSLPVAAPPRDGAAQPLAGQPPGYPSGPVSPGSGYTRSSGVRDDHPASPMQEDEATANREGRAMSVDETGRRGYSIHNRPPSSRYHAYNPVSGGLVELPATTVHEME